MAAKILIVSEEWAKHDANPSVRFVLIHSLFANLVIQSYIFINLLIQSKII